jgi:hypothetical protein
MQDKLEWADVFASRMMAAAALGDHEKATEAHIKMMELRFPQVAEHRRKFEEDASELLKKVRNMKIMFRAVDRDPSIDEELLRRHSGRR